MEFEWDEAKSERNRIERGLPFRLAIGLFAGSFVDEVDARRDYGDHRVIATGQVEHDTLVCVDTDRGEVRRVISLRRANRKERHAYRTGELSRR